MLMVQILATCRSGTIGASLTEKLESRKHDVWVADLPWCEWERYYARPTKLLEAMAAGTPYITSRVAETETVTVGSEAGAVVGNRPDVIANTMHKLLSDKASRVEKNEYGVIFITENHRWSVLGGKIGNSIMKIYP